MRRNLVFARQFFRVPCKPTPRLLARTSPIGKYADSVAPYRSFHTCRVSFYDYKPLQKDEVRLLDLQPGLGSDTLKCRLRHVSFLEKPQYESVSYCWGPTETGAIVESDDGTIPITNNLNTALQHLRQKEGPRTLWIDAVCINQSNVDERGQQVNLMKEIFRRSGRTVVWLGEEGQDSHHTMQLIRQLATASQQREAHGFCRSHESNRIPPLYDPAWRTFARLLQRPWFHRAWVVQEASVPKEIVILCGHEIISWNELVQAVRYAVDLGVFVAYGGSSTYQALRLFEMRSNFQTGHFPSLHDLLLRNRSFLATDIRDKVYALLSLADRNDVRVMKTQPDYHLSVKQLYKNITMSLLERPDLSAFNASRVHSRDKKHDLPSWVADWSASDPSVPLDSVDSMERPDTSSHIFPPLENFDASRSTLSIPSFDHEKNLLGLEGLLFDQVETVGTLSRTRYLRRVSHMLELFVQCRDILEQLKDWELVTQARSRVRYPTGEKSHNAYWHTLCAGRVPPNLRFVARDPRLSIIS